MPQLRVDVFTAGSNGCTFGVRMDAGWDGGKNKTRVNVMFTRVLFRNGSAGKTRTYNIGSRSMFNIGGTIHKLPEEKFDWALVGVYRLAPQP